MPIPRPYRSAFEHSWHNAEDPEPGTPEAEGFTFDVYEDEWRKVSTDVRSHNGVDQRVRIVETINNAGTRRQHITPART